MANTARKGSSKASGGQAVRTPPEFVDEGGYLALRGELFWKWRALNADFTNATHALAQRRTEFEQMLAATPPLVSKRDEVHAASQALAQAKRDLDEVQQAIGTQLGIDLKDCAIDDSTGRLHVLSTRAPISADVPGKKVTGVSRRGRAATKQPTTE